MTNLSDYFQSASIATPTSHAYTLVNPNAEAGDYTTGWTLNTGSFGRINTPDFPHEGSWYWGMASSAGGSVYQDVTAVAGPVTAALIAAGNAWVEVEFYQSSYEGKDEARMTCGFYDGSPGSLISSIENALISPYGPSGTNIWHKRQFMGQIPVGTQTLRIGMEALRRGGVACNSHMDSLVIRGWVWT